MHIYMDELLAVTVMHCLRAGLFLNMRLTQAKLNYRFLEVHKAGPTSCSVLSNIAKGLANLLDTGNLNGVSLGARRIRENYNRSGS